MRATNRQGRWQTKARLATEYGQFFEDWDTKANGGEWKEALRADYEGLSVSWANNAGATIGTAAFRLGYSSFAISDGEGYEDRHTVHVRTTRRTGESRSFDVGPATVLHGAGSIHDGYCAYAGAGTLYLAKIASGVRSVLTSATRSIPDGSVLSLAYRYNTSSGNVELAVMVDGAVELTATDSSSPYRMSTTSGIFGLFGNDEASIANSVAAGHLVQEWWVTDGWQAYEEAPPYLQSLARALRLYVLNRQRYSDDPTPTIRHVLSGVLTRCRWSVKRLGGCATLSATFRYPPSADEPERPQSAEGRTWVDPKREDWSDAEWMGGEVVLAVHWNVARLEPNTLPEFDRDSVWRGRLDSIRFHPDTNVVQVTASGLVANLDEVGIDREYDNTIRAILTSAVQTTAKSGSNDTYYRYNPAKIVGTQSALDLRIALSARTSTVRSVIDKLLAYLPPSVVWGVDKDGDFYLDQQLDHYEEALSGAGITHINVARAGVRYSRQVDVSRVLSSLGVQGKESDGSGGREWGGRIFGVAKCERSRDLFGDRGGLHTDSQVQSQGLALKMAVTRLKARTIPQITAKLEVVEPVRGLRSFYQLLTAASPRVSVSEQESSGQPGPLGLTPTEYQLQMFDDQVAIALAEKGSMGGSAFLASTGQEQALDRSWLLHVALKFDFAHPGSNLTEAFILGRRDAASAVGDWGWGMLTWRKIDATTGTLRWRYTDSLGSFRIFDLNIPVHPSGTGTEVNLTIFRQANGEWYAYDGNVQTAFAGLPPATTDTLQADAAPWRWFTHGGSTPPSGLIDGDCQIEHLWVYDLSAIEAHVHTSTPIQDFIARNNGRALQRMDGAGLQLYIPFREATHTFKAAQRQDTTLTRVTVTYTPSGADGTPDGSPTGTQQRKGVVVGTEKKWGGPLIFDAEQVEYEYEAVSGLLSRRFTLGGFEPSAYNTLAVLAEQQRKIEGAIRRFTEDL